MSTTKGNQVKKFVHLIEKKVRNIYKIEGNSQHFNFDKFGTPRLVHIIKTSL